MRHLRFSLILLLLFTGSALNIERLDFGVKENVVNLASFVYLLAGAAVISTILIPNKWKLSTRNIVLFWTVVYLIIKIYLSPIRPLIGGLYTYLSIAEVIVLAGLTIFTRRFMEDLRGLEETIANITMADVSSRVKSLDTATDDISKEIIRSRRYKRNLGVIVIKLNEENIQAHIDNLSKDILRTMMSRYSMSNLIRAIDKEIRRPDLILEQNKENRVILLLPETDAEAAQAMIENLQKIARAKVGSPVAIGSAVFPNDAVTFEDLVSQAESVIHTFAQKNIFEDQSIPERTVQEHIQTNFK